MIREQQWILLDNYRRKMFLKFELKRLILKSITKNETIPYTARYSALFQKNQLIRFSTIGAQRNRCVITGRVWNVLKKTKYSRFVFRNEAYDGHMPACRKATW
jgi:small subunit ribosomal protein S14